MSASAKPIATLPACWILDRTTLKWQRKAFTIVGVMDLNSRKMLHWKTVRPLKPKAVADLLEEVIDQFGNPPALVVGIDPVFSSTELKAVYEKHTCFPVDLRQGKTSVTIFIRSLWRNLIREGLGLLETTTEEVFEQTINDWLHHYNGERPHQALGYQMPDERWRKEVSLTTAQLVHNGANTDDTVVQLKITLQGIQPAIWRRILVRPSITFDKLHELIQIVMGWTNSHLHEFNVNEQRIGSFFDGLELEIDEELIDETTVQLQNTVFRTDSSFRYTYDFGDSWEHEVAIEQWLSADPAMFYPVCMDGQRNCPPEDCGGVWGYAELLTVLKDRTHPDRGETLTWLGGRYLPESFTLGRVNRQLEKRFR